MASPCHSERAARLALLCLWAAVSGCEGGSPATPSGAVRSEPPPRREFRRHPLPRVVVPGAHWAAPGGPESDPAAPSEDQPALAITFAPSAGAAPALEAVPAFSIGGLRELFVSTVWTALEGEHFEILQFRAPSGDVYYRKLLPFSTLLDDPVPFECPLDVPHAAVIQPVQPDPQGQLVLRDYLALAGSWIDDRSMSGRWSLEVFLDGAAAPSGMRSFELVP